MTKVRTTRLLVLVAIAVSVLVGCVDVDGRQATHVAWDTDALMTRDEPGGEWRELETRTNDNSEEI